MNLTDSGPMWPWPSYAPAFGGTHVHVVRIPLDSALSSPGDVLSKDELTRASRFVHAADRRRFMAARVALRCVLARYVGSKPAALSFSYSIRGRPRVASHTDAPLDFNMAHSGDLALLAIARRRVGVDIERLRRQVQRPLDVAMSCFSPREFRILAQLPDEARSRAFVHLWTRKEAVTKAIGSGLAGFDEVEVTVPPRERPAVLEAPGGARAWRLFDLEIEDEFVGAVAAESATTGLTMWEWRWPGLILAASR